MLVQTFCRAFEEHLPLFTSKDLLRPHRNVAGQLPAGYRFLLPDENIHELYGSSSGAGLFNQPMNGCDEDLGNYSLALIRKADRVVGPKVFMEAIQKCSDGFPRGGNIDDDTHILLETIVTNHSTSLIMFDIFGTSGFLPEDKMNRMRKMAEQFLAVYRLGYIPCGVEVRQGANRIVLYRTPEVQ